MLAAVPQKVEVAALAVVPQEVEVAGPVSLLPVSAAAASLVGFWEPAAESASALAAVVLQASASWLVLLALLLFLPLLLLLLLPELLLLLPELLLLLPELLLLPMSTLVLAGQPSW